LAFREPFFFPNIFHENELHFPSLSILSYGFIYFRPVVPRCTSPRGIFCRQPEQQLQFSAKNSVLQATAGSIHPGLAVPLADSRTNHPDFRLLSPIVGPTIPQARAPLVNPPPIAFLPLSLLAVSLHRTFCAFHLYRTPWLRPVLGPSMAWHSR